MAEGRHSESSGDEGRRRLSADRGKGKERERTHDSDYDRDRHRDRHHDGDRYRDDDRRRSDPYYDRERDWDRRDRGYRDGRDRGYDRDREREGDRYERDRGGRRDYERDRDREDRDRDRSGKGSSLDSSRGADQQGGRSESRAVSGDNSAKKRLGGDSGSESNKKARVADDASNKGGAAETGTESQPTPTPAAQGSATVESGDNATVPADIGTPGGFRGYVSPMTANVTPEHPTRHLPSPLLTRGQARCAADFYDPDVDSIPDRPNALNDRVASMVKRKIVSHILPAGGSGASGSKQAGPTIPQSSPMVVWKGNLCKQGVALCAVWAGVYSCSIPIHAVKLPAAVDVCNRTPLDQLDKHLPKPLQCIIYFKLIDKEDKNSVTQMQELIDQLAKNQRAGIAKVEGGTLFLVPASKFLRETLRINADRGLFGVLKLKDPSAAAAAPKAAAPKPAGPDAGNKPAAKS